MVAAIRVRAGRGLARRAGTRRQCRVARDSCRVRGGRSWRVTPPRNQGDNHSSMDVRIFVDPAYFDPVALDAAVDVLRAGGVVAYPTDTLYGLAADPRRPDAVARIFALKGRAETSPLTLIAADPDQASAAAFFTARAAALAR